MKGKIVEGVSAMVERIKNMAKADVSKEIKPVDIKGFNGFKEAFEKMNILVTGQDSSSSSKILEAKEVALEKMESVKVSRNIRLPFELDVPSWNNPLVGKVSFVGSTAKASFFLKGYVTKEQALRVVEWDIDFPSTPEKLHSFRYQVSVAAKKQMVELYMKVSPMMMELNDLEVAIIGIPKGQQRNNTIDRYKQVAKNFQEKTGTRWKWRPFKKSVENLNGYDDILPDSMGDFVAI